jgi:hypothetical protein
MKKKSIFLISLLICFLLVSSCKKKRGNVVSLAQEVISIYDSDLKERYKASDVFDSVTLIPLETVDESLIGDVSKITMTDSSIYVLDQQSQSVLKFNRQGKFLCKINRVGVGPNEYMELEDFTLTGSGNILMLGAVKRLVEFTENADPVRTHHLPFHADAVEVLNDSILIFNGSSDEDKVIVWNILTGEIVATFLEYDVRTSARISKPLIRYNNEIYFTSKYSSLIYRVTPSNLENRWFVDFGKRTVNIENLISVKTPFNFEIHAPQLSDAVMYYFTETDDYVVFNFQCEELNDGFPYHVYYSKASKTKKILSHVLFKDDFTFSSSTPYIVGASGRKEFIGILDPSWLEIVSSAENEKDEDSENYKKLKESVKGINEFDNPIVVLYSLKDF